MTIGSRIKRSKFGRAILSIALPTLLLYAYSGGPDVRHTAAPGDDPLACTTAGCHTGTALNGGGGNVAVNFPNGLTYTPGVSQTFSIVITDPKARAYGFQMTARLESNLATGQAGDFTAGAQQFVLCDDNTNARTPTRPCPGNAPVQFIEHTFPFQTNTISVQWTPPATNAGNIHIYVAANAANNDGTNQGDHIYTASYVLTPADAGTPPTVTKAVSASGFGGFPAIAPGTWIEITGTNLNSNTRQWAGDDFSGVNAPQSLDGTKVTIGGQSAFTFYISPTQVNALVPSNVAAGSQQLTVTNGSRTSAPFPVTVNATQPGLLALAQAPWLAGSKQYVVAQTCDAGKTCVLATDLTFILPTGTSIPGYPVRPAKPGETLTIYGIGFGPAIDSSNVNVPVGQIVGVANSLVNQVQMQVNGVPATLAYAGFAPGQVGLYQFNIVVPALPDGDWPLTFTQSGSKGTQSLLLSVHQ